MFWLIRIFVMPSYNELPLIDNSFSFVILAMYLYQILRQKLELIHWIIIVYYVRVYFN